MRNLLFSFFIFASTSVLASEKIHSFDSFIVVHDDATVEVTETIRVEANRDVIRHGIKREFPTNYKDRFGNHVNVTFNLLDVQMDGKPVLYHENTERNGVVVYIGDAEKLVDVGIHDYKLHYTTTRQLGFFDTFDELYWNVTGNGWPFQVDSAEATIQLPKGVSADSIQSHGYTGYFGSTESDYNKIVLPQEPEKSLQISFTTTKPLLPHQGLTVAVGWPKGFVKEPSLSQKVLWLLNDNNALILLLVTGIGVVILNLLARRRITRESQTGTIIPLFTPPNNMTPSEVRYLSRKAYDAGALSSEIVHLAILGYLTIEQDLEFLESSFVLRKTSKTYETLTPTQRKILKEIFRDNSNLHELVKSDKNIIEAAKFAKESLRLNFRRYIFVPLSLILASWILVGVFGAATVIFLWGQSPGPLIFLLGAAIVVINILFSLFLKGYTRDGRQIMDKIEGFKLFLSTTELERLNLIGTPPTRTPELFEKWLPYAMALGVEKQWTNQFTPVFNQLEHNGTAYVPIWYSGPAGSRFNMETLNQSISKSFSSAISSSSTAPGSSSGSGGRGSSGGGGGGGGGGGW